MIDAGSSGVRVGTVRAFPFLDWIRKQKGGYRLWQLFSFAENLCPWCGWMLWVAARKK